MRAGRPCREFEPEPVSHLFPHDHESDHVQQQRTVGDSVYSQYVLGGPITPVIPYTYLGIRTVANSTSAEIRVRKWFAIHAGYQYSDRRIGVIDGQENFGAPAPAPPTNIPITQSNQLQRGHLRVPFQAGAGRSRFCWTARSAATDQPYTPISDKQLSGVPRPDRVQAEILPRGGIREDGLQQQFDLAHQLRFAIPQLRRGFFLDTHGVVFARRRLQQAAPEHARRNQFFRQ